jgi:serine/threonine-protein kinase
MRGLRLRHGILCGLALASLLQVTPVAAQKAEANLLFDEARRAMASRDYAQAIAKLEQSQALDPAVGTLLNLAECYVALGRTTSAWSTYRDAASLAVSTKQPERERYASRKAQELEGKLSRLSVIIAPEARVPGLSITRSGVPIPEGLWGVAVPVDPGAHRLEAKAPGHATVTLNVQVGAGEPTVLVQVPRLPPLEAATTTATPPAPAPATPAPAVGGSLDLGPTTATPGAVAPRDDTPHHDGSDSSLPTIGWVTAGVGAVATLAGVVFYINGRMQISDANCPNQVCVRGIGDKSLHDDGRASEKLGIGLGVAGIAIAGAGVVLALSATRPSPSRPERSARLSLRLAPGSVDFVGAW